MDRDRTRVEKAKEFTGSRLEFGDTKHIKWLLTEV